MDTISKRTAAITGHRKIFGYSPDSEGNKRLKHAIKDALVKNRIEALWTGMALGTDQIAALAAIELKEEGYPIELYAAIPFKGHPDAWPAESRELYHAILAKCDRADLVHDGDYDRRALEARNRYMVDHSGLVIAVYTGAPGGTQRCVQYARREGRDILFMDPSLPECPVMAPDRGRRVRRTVRTAAA